MALDAALNRIDRFLSPEYPNTQTDRSTITKTESKGKGNKRVRIAIAD